MIPKHSKVTVPESHRPTKNSVHAAERLEDCRAVGSDLALAGDKWSVLIIVTLGIPRADAGEAPRRA
jgi:hypothetical protein